MYYVIEGQDGTGKSLQVSLLADYFRARDQEVITIEEPDGDLESARVLRELIKNGKYDLEPRTHVLLFTAARLELWTKLMKPALDRGAIVIASRNWWSTLAYQGYGQGLPLSLIENTTRTFLPYYYIQPTRAVILTLDDATRFNRLRSRDDAHKTDAFESKPTDFQKAVSDGYLKIAKARNIPTLDASPSPEVVHKEILSLFSLS